SGTSTDGVLNYALDGNPDNLNGITDDDTLASISFTALSEGVGVDQNICALANAQDINVTGDNITQNRTYEWQKQENGVWTSIPNSNTEQLSVTNATIVNGVNLYRRFTTVTLNSETCILTSTIATVTVNEMYAGSITEGTGQSLCTSEIPAQLSTSNDVAVTGGGTASYQWYKNDTGSWDVINGATETFYQPSALATSTSFKRRITNIINGFSCFEETPPVTIIVNSVVAGGTTTNQEICTLNQLQLLTVNNGDNNGTYQWQQNNLGTWEDLPGATGINYDASTTLTPGVTAFRRITTISGASCEGISTVLTLTYSNFLVGSITGEQTICYGQTPNILNSTLDATGTGSISYQWQQFNGTDWLALTGEIGTALTPGTLQETTSFRRVDTSELNGFTCSETTNEITIQVLDEVIGGDSATNQTICSDELPTTLTVANGSTTGQNISYQWQSKTSGNFANMVGETDANLTFANTPSATT
ncbi:unnamed protein product, partial [Ectocarpus sp. 12 AP-2014]